MKNRLNFWLFLTCLMHVTSFLSAQTDTEFWFAAPEVSESHGDNPILLRMSAQSQGSNVLISIPANPSFAPIGLTIPANSSQTVDLTPFKFQLENIPANTVLNKGLLIQSNNPITAYYEVDAQNNPDIFPLKGSNAKGTHFYTPFQNNFSNGSFSIMPYSGFDIVATENNTTVTIIPSVTINGHPAGTAFTVTLNRGQTYSCIANGQTAGEHPTGTEINSNRPICVTIKDDSMSNGSCRDLMGDQIIPVSLVGMEYIVMRGFLSADEYAFILGTQDGTDIFIAGNATPVATVNTGEQYMYSIPPGQATTYIETSKPAYVLHVSGFGCEVGGAVLPPIQCTGSSSVYFTRSSPDLFGLNIMVRAGSEGNFLLNSSSTLVPASAFTVVPGTSGNWMAAQISFTTSEVPDGETSVLVNTSSTAELFHMGMINGGASTGCRYGYFSDFSSTNLGGNRIVCFGDTLDLDAGVNKDSYLWSTGDTTQFITVFDEGVYYVTTSKNGCISSDTVNVVKDLEQVDLGEDTIIVCGGSTTYLNAHSGYISYEWLDGSTDSTLFVNAEGSYHVTVMSLGGCISRDTAQIKFGTVPPAITVSNNGPICEGESLELSSSGATFTVKWTGPNGFSESGVNQEINPASAQANGIYSAVQNNGECDSPPAFTNAVVNPLPNPVISGDTILCEGEETTLNLNGGPFDTQVWSTNEISSTINVPSGTWSISVGLLGCNRTVSQTVHLSEPIANFNIAPDALVFLGTEQQFTDSSLASPYAPNVVYLWDFADGEFGNGTSVAHQYADTGTYSVMLVVTNTEGCVDTVFQIANVIIDVVIPNVFSPNGDGINDLFVVKYLSLYPNSKLNIFTRWGSLVYSSDDYKNDWTGDDLVDGTYFYILETGKGLPPFKGTVLIER